MADFASPGLSRSALVLTIAGGVIAGAILLGAFQLARSIESMEARSPDSPPRVIRSRESPRESPEMPLVIPPALTLAGPGEILLADGRGRVFLIGREEDEDPPRLVLHRVYELKEDPGRHLDDPHLRSLTGWYLDDLASKRYLRVRAIRDQFEGLVSSGGMSADVVDALLALARDLAREGEVPYLTERLLDKSYIARRSAAIALGEAGWRRATPILIEIVRQKDEKAFRIAGPLLEELTGIPTPEDMLPETWQAAAGKWSAWWEEHGE